MADIAKRLMSGLGFDNFMFNIEMMYDARDDRIAVIEINPRMASQFADLYEKVDGTNAYEVLLDLGIGVGPRRNGGKANIASPRAVSCGPSRTVLSRPYLARKGSPRPNAPIRTSGSKFTPRSWAETLR